MPTPSISPTTLGARTYTVSDSKALVADLDLLVPGTGPGPTFQVSYPTTLTGVKVMLTHNGASLPLIPPVEDGAPGGPPPTFAGRHIIPTLTSQAGNSVLSCEIRALAMGDVTEPWRVLVMGLAGAACQFSQPDNDPAALTITRVVCDPVAAFTIGGSTVLNPPSAVVVAGSTVALSAQDGIGPSTLVAGPGAPRPGVVYKWTCDPGTGVAGLPACGTAKSVTFTAPAAAPASGLTLKLEVWIDGSCDTGPGLLTATATTTLTLESPPVVTASPSDRAVNAGTDATFTASARDGTPPGFTTQWQVSSDGGAHFSDLADGPAYRGTTTGTLTVTGAPPAFNGNEYQARFSNGVGGVNSAAARLTVDFAPSVTASPSDQAVNAGSGATFTAAATGNPAPSVRWQVSGDGGTTFNSLTDGAPYSGVTTPTLTITAVAEGLDKNRYRALFSNTFTDTDNSAHPVASGAATLTVKGLVTLSDEATISPANPPGSWADGNGHFHLVGTSGILALWSSTRGAPSGLDMQVFSSRLDLANAGAGFPAPQAPVADLHYQESQAAVASDGEVVLFYQGNAPFAAPLVYKKAPWQSLKGAAEQQVYQASEVDPQACFVGASGPWVVFFFLVPVPTGEGQGHYYFRRYRLNNPPALEAVDAAPKLLSSQLSSASGFAAPPATDPSGAIWFTFCGYQRNLPRTLVRLDPQTGQLNEYTQRPPAGQFGYSYPCLLCSRSGDVWAFTGQGTYSRFSQGAWGNAQAGGGESPAAVEDASGRIWLAYSGTAPDTRLYYTWYSPTTGTWQDARELAPSAAPVRHTLLLTGSTVWAFYQRNPDATQPPAEYDPLYYRQINIPAQGPAFDHEAHQFAARRHSCPGGTHPPARQAR
jgi:hypothetical protein